VTAASIAPHERHLEYAHVDHVLETPTARRLRRPVTRSFAVNDFDWRGASVSVTDSPMLSGARPCYNSPATRSSGVDEATPLRGVTRGDEATPHDPRAGVGGIDQPEGIN
jgi:hypothetical protein